MEYQVKNSSEKYLGLSFLSFVMGFRELSDGDNSLITLKTAGNQGHNIHTNNIKQQAFKYNTLFGRYLDVKKKA